MSSSIGLPVAAPTQVLSKTAKKKEKDRLRKIKRAEEEAATQANDTPTSDELSPDSNETAPVLNGDGVEAGDDIGADVESVKQEDPASIEAEIEVEKPDQQLSDSSINAPDLVDLTPESATATGGVPIIEAIPVTLAVAPAPFVISPPELDALPPKEEIAPPAPVVDAEPTLVAMPVVEESVPSIPIIEEPPVDEIAPIPVVLETEHYAVPAIDKDVEVISTAIAVADEPVVASSALVPAPGIDITPAVAPIPIVSTPVIPPAAEITKDAPTIIEEKKKAASLKGGKSSEKKSGGIFASLFCCFGSAAYEEDHPNSGTTSKPADNKVVDNAITKEKADDTPIAPSSNSDEKEDSTTVVEAPAPISVASPLAVNPVSAETPPDSASPFAAAPAPIPPSNKRRRRSGKKVVPTAVDQSIITSVPEPGMPHAQRTQDADEDDEEYESGDEVEDEGEGEEDEEMMLIARGGVGIPIGPDGTPQPLLKEIGPTSHLRGRKCLVLDLDETLVHSSFKMIQQADYVVPVEIENQYHNVYVIKRPGVDGFLKAMGEIYEIVIFTASLSKYADPVLDQLDIYKVVGEGARLFRESCYNNKGNYVKDLSQLGRPISECIIIDNSPASYVFHPNNAVPISSWFNDPHDTELTDLIPFLTDLSKVDDVRGVLDAGLYLSLNTDVLGLQDLVV